MVSLNKCFLAGNLTRDPEVRYLPNGTPACMFGIAVNEKYRDRNGNDREETLYIEIEAIGKQAESSSQYLSKGSPVLIEGQLKFHSWQREDGSKGSKTTCKALRIQFLGGNREQRPTNSNNQPPPPNPRQPPPPPANDPTNYQHPQNYGNVADQVFPIHDDDIPF